MPWTLPPVPWGGDMKVSSKGLVLRLKGWCERVLAELDMANEGDGGGGDWG